MSSPPDPADRIRAWGAELGLAVGFARPDLADAARHYREWIYNHRHGQMHYLARRLEERADPGLVLEGFKTAIVVTDPYPGGDVFGELADPSRGYIARYARGADYHDGLKARLFELMARVEEIAPQVRHRIYVDTGPLLEKELAVQAGLAWRGKHSNLLTQGGNWFLLGVVLTDLDLPADPPMTDHCGTCTACLDACPTDAFMRPYALDATRCVSYLTIELKEAIPRELRQGIGNRVFGCDDCIGICPWHPGTPGDDKRGEHPGLEGENQATTGAGARLEGLEATREGGPDPAYDARPITDAPALLELMALSREEFSRNFKRTPLFRTKRRGLLRNVAVALGNWGDAAAIPALSAAMEDDEPLIRGHAAWALGRIATPEAWHALEAAREAEEDEWVLQEIELALTA